MGRGRFLRSLKQRWWLLALLVVPITLGTLIYAIASPAQYEGFMTLADRRDTDINLPSIFESQLFGRAVNEQEVRVLNLANTISSFTVLKSAFDELTITGVFDKDKVTEADFIPRVAVNPLRGTEYLQLSYVSDNAVKSKKVVETILEKFRTRYTQLNSDAAKERTSFIKDQLTKAQELYNTMLQKQQEFQEKNKEAIAYMTTSQGLVSQLTQAKIRLADAERQRAAAQGTYDVASKQVLTADIMKPGQQYQEVQNPTWVEIRGRLAQEKANLQGLLENYGEKHPKVSQIKGAIAEDERLLENTEKTYKVPMVQETSNIFQDAKISQMQAARALLSSQAEMANAQKGIDEIQAKIDKLPAVEKELTSLQAELAAQADSVKNLTAKLEESKVREAQNEHPVIYMLDDPLIREVPRNAALKTVVALFLSLLVAVSLIASLGQVDQGTYTPVEAENSLGFPVIAVLPRSTQQRLSIGPEQATALAASYQILSNEVMAVKERLAGPGIVVAAAEPNAGRSTVAANLAISLARDGARVLVIDADLRLPSLHTHFGLENRAGLSEVLQGSATVENVVQPTGVEGLLFIAAGQAPVNPVKLFRSEAMDQFIELVSKGADFIIFDSPAGGTFGDAAVLASNVQNVVLVHEAGRAPSVAEFEFHKSLERLGVNVIGMVLNKARPDDCPAYQHFRRNYESALGKFRTTAAPSALTAGDKPVREKPQQYGSKRDDEEE
jgi:succinoglycan biosynthesis transport protein ExoP